MLLTLYFPLAASLSVRDLPDGFLSKVRDGDLPQAGAQASRWSETARGAAGSPELLRLHADMQMTLGVCDEAEEQYHHAQKAIRSSRQAIRAASCRNAGWQALFRHRPATALKCFARLLDEPNVEATQQVEAQLGIVGALQEFGRSRDSSDALDKLVAVVTEPLLSHWREIVVSLRFDLAVQRELRDDALLTDHAYWQSGLEVYPLRAVGGAGGFGLAAASDEADLHEVEALDVCTPLLRQRVHYLRRLRALARGERAALDAISAHLRWAEQRGFGDYLRTARLEAVLAALTSDAPQSAEMLLEPLRRIEHAASTGRRQLEYLYAVAKTHEALGRSREAMLLFGRYALIAAQCLRDDAQALVSYAGNAARQAPQLDDVAVRLPTRYRRAYRYLQENLNRRDLSVREVAAEVGVTERALQSAFRHSLGLSPTELIRRLRMERIRRDLLDDSLNGERTVLDTGNKWGVENRSTLLNNYRKEFHETPSETLWR
ncbi:helix-turn-helix domain-containing protein [Paraburkholderia sp. UYCP14C]|uniref:helix-turn-helix domain-containing protein n=1 Tax=Paraburkholderia sp. UYCP14C TaxID=2511130 RepID=UPI001021B7B8|nr:helix-turn-helix domain-containing protein [Paraburkholderia sp. UYCP14C]RZF23489.1 helix-turn-helix domain-containing protein [Paraburkholderia sp. UYCP14C]